MGQILNYLLKNEVVTFNRPRVTELDRGWMFKTAAEALKSWAGLSNYGTQLSALEMYGAKVGSGE